MTQQGTVEEILNLTPQDEEQKKQEEKAGWDATAFNQYISDRLPLWRCVWRTVLCAVCAVYYALFVVFLFWESPRALRSHSLVLSFSHTHAHARAHTHIRTRAMTDARHNPDPRSKQCKEELAKIDTSALPTASLIIVFHEEARSTLLRTIVSCAGRAPAHLLKEVILVDDFSQRPHLLEPLEDELAKKYPIVQLIRYMRSCTSSLL